MESREKSDELKKKAKLDKMLGECCASLVRPLVLVVFFIQ